MALTLRGPRPRGPAVPMSDARTAGMQPSPVRPFEDQSLGSHPIRLPKSSQIAPNPTQSALPADNLNSQ